VAAGQVEKVKTWVISGLIFSIEFYLIPVPPVGGIGSCILLTDHSIDTKKSFAREGFLYYF
jgi:hypothetical protein